MAAGTARKLNQARPAKREDRILNPAGAVLGQGYVIHAPSLAATFA